LAVVLAVASVLAARAWATEEKGEWKFRAPIMTAPEGKGALVEFPLLPEVYDQARLDQGDLRIYSDSGDEVPYVVRTARGRISSGRLPAKIYNRTYVPGKYSRALVDFGRKTLKNRVEVLTGGENFRRKVLLEGSDDGKKFLRVRQGAYLFRIGRPGSGGDKNVVEFPDNNQRYLQVTVFNDPEDGKVEIEDVRVWRWFETPPETEDVTVAGAAVKERKGFSEVALDLGARNLPLHDLTLRFSDANFYRQAAILGRNSADDNAPGARAGAPKEPAFSPVTMLSLYRFTTGKAKEERLEVSLQNVRYRYLLVRIDNGADKPLHFTGVSARRLASFVACRPQGLGKMWLYFGNEQASAPRYDLPHFVDRLRGEGVRAAFLGAPVPLEPGKGGAPVPWSEKYRALIWVALLAVCVVLALLIRRQVRIASQ